MLLFEELEEGTTLKGEKAQAVIEKLKNYDKEPLERFDILNECCICGSVFYGYGNNPAPVKDEGRCCNACDWDYVIPARMEARAV